MSKTCRGIQVGYFMKYCGSNNVTEPIIINLMDTDIT